jgi:hypothetical protein
LATVIGKMSTVMHYSLTYRDLVKGFCHLLLELIAKKYPRKCIQRACEKMFSKTTDSVWSDLKEFASAVYNLC